MLWIYERDVNVKRTAGLENAEGLREKLPRILQVFKRACRKYQVDGLIAQRDAPDIREDVVFQQFLIDFACLRMLLGDVERITKERLVSLMACSRVQNYAPLRLNCSRAQKRKNDLLLVAPSPTKCFDEVLFEGVCIHDLTSLNAKVR
jgi:hypothetical protein